MGKTSIEWCDFTFNPWWGCTKVSDGCKAVPEEVRQKVGETTCSEKATHRPCEEPLK